MSGPMSNLKKSRKAPFPSNLGLKNVPYRRPEAAYSADESKLLDEITMNMANNRLKQPVNPLTGGIPSSSRASYSGDSDSDSEMSTRHPAKSKNHSNFVKKKAPTDKELMNLMMSRLANLEQRVQHQAKELSQKDRHIRILEEKLTLMKKSKHDSGPGQASKAELEKKCLLLQQQVHEMEAFLEDYGMIWVGEQSDPDSSVYNSDDLISLSAAGRQGTWTQDDSIPGISFQVDYDLIIRSIQELNALAGEGLGEVHKTADGARIKTKESIPLVLYANGIVMFSGPFRPFTDAETRICLKDIADGFFPSELQKRYPDGVPFNVIDKRSVMFKDKLSEIFQGAGQSLGGEMRPSRLVPSNIKHGQPGRSGSASPRSTSPQHKFTMVTEKENGEMQLDVETELPSTVAGPRLTVDQFLHKIPKNVIKQGKVIDIRNSLGDALKGTTGPSDVTVIETEAVQDMKERLNMSEENRPASGKDLTTLRIKSEQGDHTYILKMKFNETIGDVRSYLQSVRAPRLENFIIMSAFPRRSYDDDSETLTDAGLTPNAALHLKQK